ncbi:drebrin isoform X1 [Gadus morhua]|uniref:drebrin isoform X1 n=1 Tax=Gadus morhua TaxID=8049 RepID=UPI0011B5740B|nr:drebrin isoform X1 [Gadus morhua]
MAVNLGKNRLALLTAYQDVIDEASDTDWALYSYDGDSDDLTVASSGGGGLLTIAGAFESSRVMYGFCSMKDATAALPRYVLINWVGEDVPDARKCACAIHVATVAEFFQGVNVIVNASNMEDIEPSAIGQRLTNGTTAVASPVLNRLRTKEGENGENVGTVYTKTNAEIEMKKINREEFWEKAKREEELRKEEDRKRVAEERQRFEEERMELEKKEQEERERRYREREREIEEQRKKTQEEEEAKERLRSQPTMPAELSTEELQERKESEVEEAKAIIAQRSDNPREFFKKKERGVQSVDSSPAARVRSGRVDSPFFRQQHSVSEPSSSPAPRGPSPLRIPTFTVSADRGVTPTPKMVTTPEPSPAEDASKPEQPASEATPPKSDATPPRPVQSVAPQARDPDPAPWGSATDSLVDVWDAAPAAAAPAAAPAPAPASQSTNLVDLMGDITTETPPPRPQPLLSFDDIMDASHCSAPVVEDEPSSLVDVAGIDHMTLSYQHALQHAAGEGPEGEDGKRLLTNGETALKEGTQASEGYFSQSQEDEFGQSEDTTAKPTPVFYNKPPEIDITCWDNDPVDEDDD